MEPINKKLIQDVISGTYKVINAEAIQTATAYLRRNAGTGSESRSAEPRKSERQKLEDYISKNNLWFDSDLIGAYIGKGAEQKVYRFDSKNVIKLNPSTYYRSWESYLNNLLLHNLFFPQVAYELVGFVRNKDGLNAVVKQRFVDAVGKVDLGLVKKIMEDNGFKNVKGNDYHNYELDVTVEDLHDKNVLIEDGIPYFVDTVFYIRSKEYKKFESGGAMTLVEQLVNIAKWQ